MMLREGQTILYVLVCPGYYVVKYISFICTLRYIIVLIH